MSLTKKKKKKANPWRENIEAVTVSVIIIVLFKYFVLEAYKIPTGSMQPTLMGWSDPQGGGVFDRVLVDKLSFHYRDPERFEIVVFKYPLDRSKNFIKRIVGMPGEELKIENGDIWTKGKDDADFKILRRPRRIQDVQLKPLNPLGEWALDPGWREEDGDVIAERAGRAQFPKTHASVKDNFADGYQDSLLQRVREARRLEPALKRRKDGANHVPDLCIEGRVEARADTTEVAIIFKEGKQLLEVVIPGPAAPADARPRAVLHLPEVGEPLRIDEIEAEGAYRLSAGDSVSFRAQNLNDLLILELGGDRVLEVEVPAVPQQSLTLGGGSGIDLVSRGGGAAFERLAVARDIYYTTANMDGSRMPFVIPDDSYLMLGDNTQDSSDGRDWSYARYEIESGPLEGERIDGNRRDGENPRYSEDKRTIFFHDEQGELRVFEKADLKRQNPEVVDESFVPRSLIRGRAVLVVWPVYPTFRPKWVR